MYHGIHISIIYILFLSNQSIIGMDFSDIILIVNSTENRLF